MSVEYKLTAEPRDVSGKGASRRLRREGKVPAIMYGGGRDPEMISLQQRELLKSLDYEAFYSHVLDIELGSRKLRAILKDLQRHPFKPMILHVDLQRVRVDEKIRVNVPLHFINAEIAVGVKEQGGVVSHLRNDVEVSCLPGDLPEFIEADLKDVELGGAVYLSGLKVPEGVELLELSTQGEEQEVALATIYMPRVEEEVPEEAGEAAAETGEKPQGERDGDDETKDQGRG